MTSMQYSRNLAKHEWFLINPIRTSILEAGFGFELGDSYRDGWITRPNGDRLTLIDPKTRSEENKYRPNTSLKRASYKWLSSITTSEVPVLLVTDHQSEDGSWLCEYIDRLEVFWPSTDCEYTLIPSSDFSLSFDYVLKHLAALL